MLGQCSLHPPSSVKGDMFLGNTHGNTDMSTPLIVGRGRAQVNCMLPSLHIDLLVLWETRVSRMTLGCKS